MTPRVLLLGLDGAMFDLIEPWTQGRLLLYLQRLLETGHGPVRAQHPSVEPSCLE